MVQMMSRGGEVAGGGAGAAFVVPSLLTLQMD